MGRYPNDPGWKSASKIGSKISLSAPCTTRSRIAGIERTRTLPPSFDHYLRPAHTPSRSVSILQTWTYKPQKRQDVSDFALTYSLRLRSCKSLDAFIISSLPSRLKETLQAAGSLAPWALLHFLATKTHPPPSRLRSISRFSRLYDLPCSGDFAPGRGGLRQLLGMPLLPCCRFHPAEVEMPHRSDFGTPCCLHPTVAGSPSDPLTFEATSTFTVVTAR